MPHQLKFALVLWTTCSLLLMPVFAISSGLPEQINYQGRLTDDIGNPVPDGDYEVVFALYDSETGGTPQWIESQGVLVMNGIFNTKLPADIVNNPITDALKTGRYLGITVPGNSEMTPRQLIVSAPFALWSMDSEMLGGRTVSDLDDRYVNKGQDGAINSTMIEDGSITSSHLAESYIGTSGGAIGGSLKVSDSLSIGTDTPDNDDTIYMDDGSELFSWKEDLDDNETNGINGGFTISDDLEVGGNIIIGRSGGGSYFKYKTPRSILYDIPASAFIKDGSFTDTVWVTNSDYAMTSNAGTSDHCYVYAPVYLPHGAIITKVTVLYYDYDPSGKSVYISFDLSRIGYSSTTGSSLASAWTISNVYLDGINYLTDNTISNARVSSGYRYTLKVYWDPTDFSSYLRFYGARISYTIDTAGHDSPY